MPLGMRGVQWIVVGAMVIPGVAHAQPRAIDVTWSAPGRCPEAAAVEQTLDRLLGGPPQGEPRLWVEGRIEPVAAGWELTLRMRDAQGTGERTLTGASCDEVTEAGALVIALAFDPEAVTEAQANPPDESPPPPAPPPPGESPPAAPPPPVPPASGLPAPAPPEPRTRPVASPALSAPPEPSGLPRWWSLEALTKVDGGSLPSAAVGLGGRLELELFPWRARLEASYLLPVEQTLADRPAGGRFDLWTITPSGCFVPWQTSALTSRRLGDMAVAGCVGLEVGAMGGEGFGVTNPGAGTNLWIAPRFGAELDLTLHRFVGLRAGVELAVPALRPDFVLSAVGVVHRAAVAAGRGRLGLRLTY